MTGTAENCRACDKPLPKGRRGNQVYCDRECQKAFLKRKWSEQNPKSPLGAFNAGTIAEANAKRVEIDLLSQYHHVYRAAFPAMPYDFIIYTWSKELQVWFPRTCKVVAGHKTAKGTVVYPSKPDSNDAELMAVVLTDGTIVYKPEL